MDPVTPPPTRQPAKDRDPRAKRRKWAGRLLLPLLPLPWLWLTTPAARADSRTAESIWSQSDAEQQAISQIPERDRGRITQTRCTTVDVQGNGLPRYRCTVWFEPSATPATQPPAQPSAKP